MMNFFPFLKKENTLGDIKGIDRQQPEGNNDAESVLGNENLRHSGSPAAALINISLLLFLLHQHTWRSALNSLSFHLLRTSPRLSFPLLGRCTKSFNYIYSCMPWWTV